MNKTVKDALSTWLNRRAAAKSVGNSGALDGLGIKGKIFCLSMQRSGTSSVGDFLEQWGLRRAGHQLSRKHNWSRHWYNGNFEAIFSDPVFEEHDVFEDDPFWFPEFYKFVYHRVPDSRFILLTRDADQWFKSMIRHTDGYVIGRSDIHAKVYRREKDLMWLAKNIPDFNPQMPKGMLLFDKAQHYKEIYERHNEEVRNFFSAVAPNALFHEELSGQDVWKHMANWLALPVSPGIALHAHAHKAKSEYKASNLMRRRDGAEKQ